MVLGEGDIKKYGPKGTFASLWNFEPSAYRLRGDRSNQAELWAHNVLRMSILFINLYHL